jgi:hypothetical protein
MWPLCPHWSEHVWRLWIDPRDDEDANVARQMVAWWRKHIKRAQNQQASTRSVATSEGAQDHPHHSVRRLQEDYLWRLIDQILRVTGGLPRQVEITVWPSSGGVLPPWAQAIADLVSRHESQHQLRPIIADGSEEDHARGRDSDVAIRTGASALMRRLSSLLEQDSSLRALPRWVLVAVALHFQARLFSSSNGSGQAYTDFELSCVIRS